MKKEKIAFVIQRYGQDVNGGAEYECRVLAEHLSDLYEADVFTSCARAYNPWDNYYKAGREIINGVNVIRFPVERKQDRERLAHLTIQMNNGHTEREDEWIEEVGPFCPQLINHIEKCADRYKAVIFFCYDYYTTVVGLKTGIKNAVLVPAAHDAPGIYYDIYRKALRRPKAFLYNSIEEREFLIKHFHTGDKKSRLTCVGIEIPRLDYWGMPECLKQYDNYVIYTGRVSNGKNYSQLNRYFIKYKEKNPSNLKLLVVGRIDNYLVIENHSDIVYLGYMSEEDKIRLMRNARFLILPSEWESLSLVILESMAVKRPVLVNGKCEVLKGQCIRSNAGLYYSNYIEFEYAMNYILNNEGAYNEMCENGSKFVRENYNWDKVVRNVASLIEEL